MERLSPVSGWWLTVVCEEERERELFLRWSRLDKPLSSHYVDGRLLLRGEAPNCFRAANLKSCPLETRITTDSERASTQNFNLVVSLLHFLLSLSPLYLSLFSRKEIFLVKKILWDTTYFQKQMRNSNYWILTISWKELESVLSRILQKELPGGFCPQPDVLRQFRERKIPNCF